MVHWLKEMWPPSSTDCNPSDYFLWCVVEREVTKFPHITLASLKVMTSDLMTNLDREVIIHASSSGLGLRLLWRPLGFSLNKCVIYMHINFPWKFHQNLVTLTITFIVLNVSPEFVLIYHPHPVDQTWSLCAPYVTLLWSPVVVPHGAYMDCVVLTRS